MDAIDLSRIQFGFTAAFHFLFVPLTLGLMALIALMESARLVTGNPRWGDAARFWGRFFLINFVCGVMTGYPLRRQLEANWESYSDYVQNVFQAIFSLEGVIAPFLFGLVILLFGFGSRLKPIHHCLASCALALLLLVQSSAILTLNAWMQYPVGVEFVAGRAHLIGLAELFANPLLPSKILHTVGAAYVLGSAFVIAISAWYLLRGRDLDIARRSLRIAAIFGLGAVLVTAAMGHHSGQLLVRYQPMKFAAIEGLWQTEPSPAPLTLLAWPDMASSSNRFELRIPQVLGWLANDSSETPLTGIRDLVDRAEQRIAAGVREGAPGTRAIPDGEHLSLAQYERRFGYAALLPSGLPATPEHIAQAARSTVPQVPTVFWSFRVMAGCGVLLLGLFAYLVVRTPDAGSRAGRAALWLCVLALPLPWIAIEAGWMVCEIGRQPWTITGLLPTARSAGFLAAGQVAWTLAGFAAAYTVLFAANLWLNLRCVREGPGVPSRAQRRSCAAPRGQSFDQCIDRSACDGCAFHVRARLSARHP